MALSNVNIILGNGNLGKIDALDDGVAGLIVTGTAVAGKLELNKVYPMASTASLGTLGITAENNPLAYKDIAAFYQQTGEGAELYLLVVSEASTLTQMCSAVAGSPLKKLVDYASGRIRLVGVNRNTPVDYIGTFDAGIDQDVITAIEAANSVAESCQKQVRPFRLLLPALGWTGSLEELYKPRMGSANGVGLVMASDGRYGESTHYSAAIGQVLGRAASIPVCRSIARVRDGSIAALGYLTDGKTPEEHFDIWDALDAAGYIFYRSFTALNGYYLNADNMCAPASDDYSELNLGRVIDKAVILAYKTYITEIADNIIMDEEGKIPVAVCKAFETMITRAVNISMGNEISRFTAYVDPKQNVLSSGILTVDCKIVPLAILKTINVNLSFENPANN